MLKAHFSPQASEIVRRNTFYNRNQAPEETASFYIAELRRLAQHCNFPNLEEMLRDRLVCGLRDEQNRLFAKKPSPRLWRQPRKARGLSGRLKKTTLPRQTK
ncbi:hypothetical protein MTO96_049228 [Rhipicephalus appendiculatus]